jgi:hypothetical protein
MAIMTQRSYNIESRLYVEYMNMSVEIIPLFYSREPVVSYKESTNIEVVALWDYEFINSNIGLNDTFRYVYLEVYIPEKCFEIFSSVYGNWLLIDPDGNNDGVINDNQFEKSDDWSNYYSASLDLTYMMFFGYVPNEISLNIFLKS